MDEYHKSAKESRISKAFKACSLACLKRSKLSYETAFYKHLVAYICIVILSYEIILEGFGNYSLKPDFKILFWSYWGDNLDCGGGGGGGWT